MKISYSKTFEKKFSKYDRKLQEKDLMRLKAYQMEMLKN